MLLQRGSTRPPPPPVTAAAPVTSAPPAAPSENRGAPPAIDARVAVRERSTVPAAPAVRERASAGLANSPPDASPRPVRPLRRRVAAATEASASARAKLQQGDESLRAGRLFEALVAFREALDSDPSFATAARRLGDAYRQHHDTALAIAAYERYLEMEPSAGDAEEVRSALEELRDPPSAVE
jgi:tetratricopeptide (TPR) repeat protein